jgi:hypothetical protein
MIEIAPFSWFDLIVGGRENGIFKSFHNGFAIVSYYPLKLGSPIKNLWLEFYDN